MRSWKTPALLATVGLCGLGSLFAQGPVLPSTSEPTPVSTGPTMSIESSPMIDVPAPASYDSSSIVPAPIEQSYAPVMDNHDMGSSPVYSDSVVHESAPSASCDGCTSAAPVAAAECCAASAHVEQYVAAPMQMAPSQMDSAPMMAQPSCGCQGGSSMSYGAGHSARGTYGNGYSLGSLMGSGSGVSSGLLSPNANSGGLHTRYPYYNYRHPWFYQGPPSQNVTIVW